MYNKIAYLYILIKSLLYKFSKCTLQFHVMKKNVYNFLEDISTWLQRWTDLENAKEDATNAYQTQMKYNSFIACLLEKQGLVIICNNYYTNK